MTKTNFTRMLRGKFRTNTCRIIILTSLVWLLVDVIIIMNYTSNYTEKRKGEYDVEVSGGPGNPWTNLIKILNQNLDLVVNYPNVVICWIDLFSLYFGCSVDWRAYTVPSWLARSDRCSSIFRSTVKKMATHFRLHCKTFLFANKCSESVTYVHLFRPSQAI